MMIVGLVIWKWKNAKSLILKEVWKFGSTGINNSIPLKIMQLIDFPALSLNLSTVFKRLFFVTY